MRHSTSILLLCLISVYGKTQSADPSTDILPPNPTAAAITKYVDFPVNTSTGIPSISIPLGAVVGNGISVPVSMDYHAGGVKVDEVSSIVGLGWSLSAGGAINRTVMGIRDEDVNGFMYTSVNVPTPPSISPGAEFSALQAFSNGTWDGQPDVFQFSFGGYSGKFVFENSTTIRLIPRQDLKITYITCTGAGCPVGAEDGSIISFTITTPDGVQYLFGTIDAVETSKTVNNNLPGYSGCRPKEFTAPTITSWQLKSVTNPKNGDVITLNYNSYSISYEASYNESFKYENQTNNSICDNSSSTSKCITTKTDNGKILSSIVSSLGKIEFTPNGTRSDVSTLSGNYRITEARIYGRNSQLLKSFQCTQTFVQTNPSPANSSPTTAAATKYRMYLDAMSEYSSTGAVINTWNFEYYSRTSLPPRLSYKQDHWGYFNNKNNTQLTPTPNISDGTTQYIQSQISSFSPANRDPDGAYAYYGNIKKVTYPTGGYVEYEYEGNEVSVCRNLDVSTPASASADLMYTGTYGETLTVNFTIDKGQTVPVTYSIQQNGTHFEGAYAKLKRLSPNAATIVDKGHQLQSPQEINGTENYWLSAGDYQLEVKVYLGPLGSGYPFPFDVLPDRATISVPYIDAVPTYFYNKPTGGIRLKKTTTSGVSGNSADIIKTYQYNKSNPDCTNASSAVYMGSEPSYSSAEYALVDGGGLPCDYENCVKIVLSSSSILNLTNTAGSIVNYYETWESQGANAENGKKYYRHSIYGDDRPLQGPNIFPLFLSTPNIDYGWKNSKVLEEKTLNAQNQTVFQKLYDYEFAELTNQTFTKGFVARKAFNPPCFGNYTYYCDGENNEGDEYLIVYDLCGLPIDEWCPVAYTFYSPCYNQPAGTQITSYEDIAPYAYEWYDVISQFVYLKKTTERIYNSDGSANYVETITDYGYDLPAMTHLMPIKTTVTNSDNTQYITQTKYPPQYSTTTVTDQASVAIKALKDNFMIDQPIETVQTIKKGTAESVTSGQIVKFKNFGGTRIMPNETWRIATAAPIAIAGFTFSNISGGNFGLDSRYYQTGTMGAYDTKANLTEWNKKDDQVNSFVYGHNLSLPTAYVRNALSSEVAYTSFEEQPLSTPAANGNWTIVNASPINWNTAAGFFQTGSTGFNVGILPTTITSASLPAGTYVVSFWYRDGQIKVNSTAIGTVASSTWLYAETTIVLSANSTVSITGTATSTYIDELRLHPSDALMRSFSYNDLSLNLISMTDENSVSAHYDYDNSQRLQAVRDQDRNILQTYEYNYQQAGPALNDIKSRTALITGQTTVAQVNALTGANVRRVFQYMDGLGRPIQTNEVAQSPTNLDIVAYQPYDAFGRDLKKYIPYTITSNGGTYRTGAVAEQLSFANTFGAAGYGYSETKVEPSPLNRPIEQAAPGDTWRIGNTRTLKYAYRGNTTADAVHDFYSGIPLLGTNIYQANFLWVTQETDENDRKKWTFTDKLGRVILVKQELNSVGEIAQTYTVYDDFGRVLCVIPPETTKRMISSSSNWDINHATYASMIFKYAYDSRGRMTSKTVPSGGMTSIAYDRLDRPVLSTDAKSFKVFTRYDILSRPIVSGKYKGAGSPGATDPLFETSNTTAPHYYTSTSFPTDNNLDVYKVFYYDDYDLDNNGSLGATETYTNPAESGYDAAAFLRSRGKPTASKVGILLSSGLAPTTFLTTRTYYDKEYGVIQVNKQNHLGGADISSSAYDFANRVTKTRRDHTATPPGGSLKTYYIREEYIYDAASRLRFTRHHISTTAGVPTAGWVVTSAPLYDELGRLLDKRLHASNYDGSSAVTLNSTFTYLQSLDYTYNIRGWLTGINDPTICTAQSGDDAQIDLFRMSLEYESTANGGTAQYNGNISTIQWNTYINGTCGTRHLYRFGYDYSNRLTAANYRARVGATWVDLSKYTENNITYDLNGNLKTYFRRGNIGASLIDNLTYTYGDAARPDRLTNMVDAGDAAKGFKYTSGAADYSYDLNGNMTQDNHKGFTFAYNYLNLPQTMTQGANVITLTYTAGGEKLTKALSGGGATKSYISGIEYSGTNLEAIYFSEGRCTPNGASAFYYDYTIKDHLGNARENFRASGGTAITHLEDMHYYPFGMLMEGMGTNTPTNDYAYNGKELNEDFGLNLSDYGARWYDANLGRWWSLDPMGEKYKSWSGYNYGLDNPIKFIDPDGMQADNIIINENTTSSSGALVTTRYEYKSDSKGNYGFIDPASGAIYSGGNTYINQAGTELNTLRSQPVGKALVDGLIADPTDVEIASRNRNAADEAMGSFVLWNAKGTTSAPDESGSSTRPTYIGLAHELAHVEDVKNGTINRGTWLSIITPAGTTQNISNSEIYATHKENLIRKEHGLQLRKYYAVDASGSGDKSTQIVQKGQSLYYNSVGVTTFNKVKKIDQFKY